MRHRLGSALLATTLSFACTDRALSRDRAAELIKARDGFRHEPHFWIQTDTPLREVFSCRKQADVERAPINQFLTRQGWVRYETRSAVIGLGTKANCPSMTLTPAGEAASGRWTRARGSSASEVSWAVPIGRRELVQVTGLTAALDGSTIAEFDWKWVPNEIGVALRQSVSKAGDFFERTRKGRATCRRWDDGWRCELGMWTTPADALGEFSAP